MDVRGLIKEGVALFKNKKFDEAIEKLNQALDGIEDKNSQIQEQNDIQFWLGRCYLEQAMKAQGKESEQLFGQAVEHLQQSLKFAKQPSRTNLCPICVRSLLFRTGEGSPRQGIGTVL